MLLRPPYSPDFTASYHHVFSKSCRRIEKFQQFDDVLLTITIERYINADFGSVTTIFDVTEQHIVLKSCFYFLANNTIVFCFFENLHYFVANPLLQIHASNMLFCDVKVVPLFVENVADLLLNEQQQKWVSNARFFHFKVYRFLFTFINFLIWSVVNLFSTNGSLLLDIVSLWFKEAVTNVVFVKLCRENSYGL